MPLVKNNTGISLRHDLGLELVLNQDFFEEWQDQLPEINNTEKQLLDDVREGYIHWVQDPPLLDKPVQMVILSPLLLLGKFFLSPFRLKVEKSIEFQIEDEGTPIPGQLDIFRLTQRFWIMAVESQRFSFSSHAGEVELLTHIQSNLQTGEVGYGLVITGGQSVFFKLVKDTISKYTFSNSFSTWNEGNELYDVFRALKRISQL